MRKIKQENLMRYSTEIEFRPYMDTWIGGVKMRKGRRYRIGIDLAMHLVGSGRGEIKVVI